MQQNLIPANKDPKILIKEKDKYFWHVEQTRRDVKPGTDGTNIRVTTTVKVYSNHWYNFIFQPEKRKGRRKLSFKGGMNLLPACGIREARLVHDPILQRQMDEEAKESSFAKRMAEAKAAKAVKVDDDMAQGESASGPGADDTGTAKRPRRKTN
jgi:hypothetical protein